MQCWLAGMLQAWISLSAYWLISFTLHSRLLIDFFYSPQPFIDWFFLLSSAIYWLISFTLLSPLWEMVQEGVDLKSIKWTQHWRSTGRVAGNQLEGSWLIWRGLGWFCWRSHEWTKSWAMLVQWVEVVKVVPAVTMDINFWPQDPRGTACIFVSWPGYTLFWAHTDWWKQGLGLRVKCWFCQTCKIVLFACILTLTSLSPLCASGHRWATQIVKHMSDQGNPHNNGPHQDKFW